MKNLIGYLAALSLVSLPLAAQERGHEEGHSQPQGGHSEGHNEGPRANAPVGHGYIPSRGPAPTRSAAPVVNRAPVAQGQPDPQHHAYRDQRQHKDGCILRIVPDGKVRQHADCHQYEDDDRGKID